MSSFKNTCDEFCIPLAEEKTEGPKTVLTFLGIVIDTDKMESISKRKNNRFGEFTTSYVTENKNYA